MLNLEDQIWDFRGMREWTEVGPLQQYLESTLNIEVSSRQIENVLKRLLLNGYAERRGDEWRLLEYDCGESELYRPLLHEIRTVQFLAQISVQAGTHVSENIAHKRPAAGRYTQPDLLLASIHKWRFDPKKSLEVFSFEVKNREGSDVTSVYEALAHARFVNHPYLVIPRSRLETDRRHSIRSACEREGVGLIEFDLLPSSALGSVSVRNLSVEVQALRRETDPKIVEQFLETRLGETEQKRLEELGKASNER